MKRIGRYIFNALTLLSLVLCVTAGGLWRRSYSVGDLFHACTDGKWFYGIISEGHVVIGDWSREEHDPPSLHPDHVRYTIAEVRSVMKVHGRQMATQTRLFGIEYRRAFSGRVTTTRDVVFSFGHVVALTGALPLLKTLMITLRALRPIGAAKTTGRCLKCGYDLRATPDRCPECGTIAAKA